ncbi:MAG: hypothetical protein IJ036_03330 [Lachnospiraceae bacterium]|nr:hypothetical protein [Lachnospiraceae bacterium]
MKKGIHLLKSIRFDKYGVYFLLSLFVLLLIGGTVAKYIYETGGKNLFSAKNFYFSSNLLKEEAATYTLNSTATEVTFTLGNNADDLRCSEENITYVITVTGGTTPATLNISEGILEKDIVSTESITLSGLKSGETYTVTAVGTTGEGNSGYKKTLSATFTLSGATGNLYKYLDTSNSAYVMLTVWSENIHGDISVVYEPDGLIPDNTDSVLRNVTNYANGIYSRIIFEDTTNFQTAYSSYTYRFFTNTPDSIRIDDFDIKMDGTHIAGIGTP